MRNIAFLTLFATLAQAVEITSPVASRVVSQSGLVLPGLDWKALGTAKAEDALGMSVPVFGPLPIS